MNAINNIETAFWALLRMGLWQRTEPLPPLAPAQWQELLRLAQRSGAAGIVAEGIQLLPAPQRPPQPLLQEWVTLRAKLIHRHQRHNSALAHLSALFAELGIPFLLLKGQGCALQYETPTCRSSTDIDLYTGPATDALLSALQQRGITCEEEINDTEKHATLFFEGVRIELHHYAALMDTPRGNRLFQQWWAEGAAEPERVVVASTPLHLPPATQNAFFIFFHAYHHFSGMDIHFAAFCDVARFLHTHRDSIDPQSLRRMLEANHLLPVWQAFGAYLEHYLGLPADELPLRNPSASCRGILRRLRRHCLFPTPRRRKRPSSRLGSKLYSLGGHLRAFGSTLRLFPAQASLILLHRLVAGMVNLFNRKNRDGTAQHYLARTQSEKTS